MKKITASILLACISYLLHAQVAINPQLPAAGLYLKAQLWNMSIINTSGQEPLVQVEVTITNAAGNQQVLSGISRIFKLQRGVKQLQSTDLDPVVYNVINARYGIDANPNGMLPMGVFMVCYRVLQAGEVNIELTRECETVEIEPVRPPVLTLPYDGDSIETTRPLFSWIPPAPVNYFSALLYDVVLVEVNKGQNSTTAIQQNIPVYTTKNYSLVTQPYPPSYPELNAGKLYAWQVTAKNEEHPIASSEVWTFTIRQRQNDTTVAEKGQYARLRRENDAAYIICKDVLRYEYRHERNDTTVQIKLFDISKPVRTAVRLNDEVQTVRFGRNMIDMDVAQLPGMINRHVYLLELTNAGKQKWYVKFEYKPNY